MANQFNFQMIKSAVDLTALFFMRFEKEDEKGYASFNGIRKEKYDAGYDKWLINCLNTNGVRLFIKGQQ